LINTLTVDSLLVGVGDLTRFVPELLFLDAFFVFLDLFGMIVITSV